MARTVNATSTTNTQHNLIDADSYMMSHGSSYLLGYNCQSAVDSDPQVIVTLDADYRSQANAKACTDQGIDAYKRYAEAKGYSTAYLPHGISLRRCGGRC